ncbi:hypothetical protein EV2_011736 [Malus domestica]
MAVENEAAQESAEGTSPPSIAVASILSSSFRLQWRRVSKVVYFYRHSEVSFACVALQPSKIQTQLINTTSIRCVRLDFGKLKHVR